jgi:hypothetical protein
MNMIGLGGFFKKVQSSFSKEISLRMTVSGVIRTHVGVEIPIESISYKNKAIILRDVNQAVRSAIFIKKQAILKEIAEKQDVWRAEDIR